MKSKKYITYDWKKQMTAGDITEVCERDNMTLISHVKYRYWTGMLRHQYIFKYN